MKTALIVTASLLSAAAAQAAHDKQPDPVAGASKDACVFINNIQGWRVLDSRTILLFAPNSTRMYLAQLGMPISDLKFATRIAFVDDDHNGQLCGRSPDKIAAPGSLVRQPSTIMGMTQLNDEQVRAVEAKYDVRLRTRKDDPDSKPADSKQIEQPSAGSPVT